jgi:ribosome maturation factor RimP
MIEKKMIKEYLGEVLAEAGCFLVDIKVDKANRIMVQVDRNEGISIEDCVHISRQLEARMDRDREDFALEVSSPGLDAPFKVPEQYMKNTGKEVRIETGAEETIEGEITGVEDTGISLKTAEGKNLRLDFEMIRTARRILKI